MNIEHRGSSSACWVSERDAGVPSTWTFTGTDGLARLSGPCMVDAAPAESFSARLTRLQLDHIALEIFEASPHTWSRSAAQLATHPTPTISVVLQLEGAGRVELDTTSFTLDAGECYVADSREALTYTAVTRSRLLRAVVGLEHLPHQLSRGGARLSAPLHRTALVDSFIAFISSILTSTASGQRAHGSQLISAVADLHAAVLTEAQQAESTEDHTSGLRVRMEQYIEAHYSEPDLDPEQVAQAFHVSLRQAHHLFNDGEHTIARYIRDTRVDAVALELRTAIGPVRLSDLARRHGFRHPEGMTRAFQQRFTMSPTAYRNKGHRDFD